MRWIKHGACQLPNGRNALISKGMRAEAFCHCLKIVNSQHEMHINGASAVTG